MDCSEAQPLLAAYALGVLEGRDKSNVEKHVWACSACREELEGDQRVVARLPSLVAPAMPPAALKARLMARAGASPIQGTLPGKPSAAERTCPAPGRGMPFQAHALPALVLSISLVALLVIAWGTFETIRVNKLSRQNEELASALRRQWSAINLAADPGIVTISFRGSEASPSTRGNLLFGKENQDAMILVADLEPPASDEVYQLWLIDPDGTTRYPVGIFRTAADGSGVWTFQPPATMAPYAQDLVFGVTLEPYGGSIVPSSPVLFTVPIVPQ